MFDEEAYRKKHNIQHKPAKNYRPMDLSDINLPITEPEQPKQESNPNPVPPDVLGQQMDDRFKEIMKRDVSSRASEQSEQVSVKKPVSHADLNEKSKMIDKFIQNPYAI